MYFHESRLAAPIPQSSALKTEKLKKRLKARVCISRIGIRCGHFAKLRLKIKRLKKKLKAQCSLRIGIGCAHPAKLRFENGKAKKEIESESMYFTNRHWLQSFRKIPLENEKAKKEIEGRV